MSTKGVLTRLQELKRLAEMKDADLHKTYEKISSEKQKSYNQNIFLKMEEYINNLDNTGSVRYSV
ncbi:MAG: hypothetical protein N4A72_00795 [Bacteroidales bacterium]|jgi:hypothetical protein|nr:hypothetical protein [Bacteroidales bacterium]